MKPAIQALAICAFGLLVSARAATFGTVVPLVGGASDIVLDEARGRLYLVNNSQNRVEVYSIPQRRFLTPIPTDANPISAALSRSGKILYVTSYDGSSLDLIDTDALALTRKVSIPAKPEGVAVGADERVLISTIGTGTGNAFNVLLIYDPSATASNALLPVPISPPAPGNPPIQAPPPSGRPYLVSRSQLQASPDGSIIAGANIPNATTRTVFVYESASGTVLRSRTVNNISSVLAVSADNSRFMSGLSLFDSQTLEVIAQQNLANSPYPLPTNANFNTQTNQGGSVFSPDGSRLYSAFDITPVQNPPARPNISQLMVNDPDNLLIRAGYQLPENLSGKMVISSDGGTIYTISESGFMILPVGSVQNFPIATPAASVVVLAKDQCGVTAPVRTATVPVRNDGRGRFTVSATVLQNTTTGPAGLGGAGGAGGGIPGGGGIIVILPGGVTGGGGGTPVTAPPTGFPANTGVAANAPAVRARQTSDGAAIDFTYTTASVANSPGTVTPPHTFLIQSNEAINIPPSVQVFQNFRNSEAGSDVVPVPVGTATAEGLVDLVYDGQRQRLYIANSGLNRIEVFDARAKQFLSPIKAGQLPRSIALSPDGSTLYVANTGGENIGVIDLNQGQQIGRIRFPALPFNANAPLVSPSVLVATQRGPMIIMSNGQIWKVVGNDAIPRPQSSIIGSLTVTAPRSMAATPNGEYALVLAGNGFVYLYDASIDDFVQGRQIFSAPIQGYYGPVAAGPRGAYFLVNGTVLNQSLTPVASAGSVQIAAARPGAAATTYVRPISAVAAGGTGTFFRFAPPFLQTTTTLATDPPSVEVVDVNTGVAMRAASALEGGLSTSAGTTRVNINGRTMAVDTAGTTAYVLTESGLSIVSLDNAAQVLPTGATRPNPSAPSVNPGGVVNLGSYLPAFAPGSLISIFGRNLGAASSYSSTPLPSVMSNLCVTLNNQPLPLLMTSDGQLNAQIPPEIAAGRYPLVIRSIGTKTASVSQTITIAKVAPAIFADLSKNLPSIYHADGKIVDKDHPARRDEPLVMYAIGLGATQNGKATSGNPSPSSPLATVAGVKVFFGDPKIKQAEVIVDFAGLAPGMIGIYQINMRVPGDHVRGDALPVTLRVGTVDSQHTGPVVPYVSVD